VKVLFLMSGGYGAGKTYFAHQLVSPSNTVALAAPIRTDLFKIFLDSRIHSTDQDVKNELVGEAVLKRALSKSKVSKVSKPLLDKFYEIMSEKDLTKVTIRDILVGWGDAGRAYRKDYWVKRTIQLLEELNSNLIAVDDVRFINEKEKLCKWAEKQGYSVQHYFMGHPDDGYENVDLSLTADYQLFWR
jgi:hypothetical protein